MQRERLPGVAETWERGVVKLWGSAWVYFEGFRLLASGTRQRLLSCHNISLTALASHFYGPFARFCTTIAVITATTTTATTMEVATATRTTTITIVCMFSYCCC